MEKYKLDSDLKVFGKQVITFPLGIKEAFDHLMAIVPDANRRSYYGLSRLDDQGGVLYYAAVQESHKGEAQLYGMECYTIPEGKYSAVTITNWMQKTDCIKDVFHELMQGECADLTTLCVEWYKSDAEMMCMMKDK